MTAAGHDGLWYWTQARQMAAKKQPWNAWLYYQAAQKLLQPADFVVARTWTSCGRRLRRLRRRLLGGCEHGRAAGSEGAPMGRSITSPDWAWTTRWGSPAWTLTAHLHVDSAADPAAARKRNSDAASALLAAYPEMRKAVPRGVDLRRGGGAESVCDRTADGGDQVATIRVTYSMPWRFACDSDRFCGCQVDLCLRSCGLSRLCADGGGCYLGIVWSSRLVEDCILRGLANRWMRGWRLATDRRSGRD